MNSILPPSEQERLRAEVEGLLQARMLMFVLCVHEIIQTWMPIGLIATMTIMLRSSGETLSETAILTISIAYSVGAVLPVRYYGKRVAAPAWVDRGLKGLSLSRFFGLFVALLGVNAVGSLIVTLTEAVFNGAGWSIIVDTDYNTLPARVLLFVHAVLIAPLLEEYIYRGVALGALRRFGDAFAVTVSAVIFGLAHGNLMQLMPAALIGAWLGYVRVKTGSWGVCVLLHALNNLFAEGMNALQDRLFPVTAGAAQQVYVIFIVAYYALTLGLGLYLLARYHRQYGALDTQPKAATEAGEKPLPAMGYGVMLSPWSVLYVMMALALIVMTVSPLA